MRRSMLSWMPAVLLLKTKLTAKMKNDIIVLV